MLVRVMLVALVCGSLVAGQAYLKAWDDAQPEEGGRAVYAEGAPPPPFDPALLARLQASLGAGGQPPSKRQMRYNQCYFNPISCFRRRK